MIYLDNIPDSVRRPLHALILLSSQYYYEDKTLAGEPRRLVGQYADVTFAVAAQQVLFSRKGFVFDVEGNELFDIKEEFLLVGLTCPLFFGCGKGWRDCVFPATEVNTTLMDSGWRAFCEAVGENDTLARLSNTRTIADASRLVEALMRRQ